jgi:hypothetical protein
MSHNRVRSLELIKKSLYDINVGKIKEHKTKSNANIIDGYIRKFNYVHDFGHPSSGGSLIMHDIVRKMKM